MPINEQGIWVPNLSPKQFDIFNDNHRYLLVNGPRISGKTIGVLHKVVRHLWEVPNACVGMFAKTIKSAKQRGTFNDLTSFIIPEWMQAGMGFEYISRNNKGVFGPVIDNQTRTSFLSVTNMHGGQSHLYLYSIDYAGDAEQILKSNRYSMIYFSELGNFDDKVVFTASIPQLRMVQNITGITEEMHQWISDCNPTEQGTDSWIYKTFYEDRQKTEFGDMEEEEKEILLEFQKNARVIEVHTKDNPFITRRQINEIKSLCHDDPALYARYVNGEWVAGGNLERHFASSFNFNIHVLGDITKTRDEEWDVILPTEECRELCTGWDPGDTNQAAVIFERVNNVDGTLNYYAVLDELIHLKEEISVENFTLEFLQKMERIEEQIGRKITWRHWSDSQALEQWKSAIGGVTASQIRNISRGRIVLTGACKERDSVRMRVQLLKRLLQSRKVYFSANCIFTIQSIQELRVQKKDFVQRINNKYKHAFDALTYGLAEETIAELDYTYTPMTGKTGLILMK
jgi:hypothetical protein